MAPNSLSIERTATDKPVSAKWIVAQYVRSSARSQGVGRVLVSWVAWYALENGCRRIDWPVKASSAKGISFYEDLGAEQVVERLSYRLSEPGMSQLGRESTSASLGG